MPSAPERKILRRSPVTLRVRGGTKLDRARFGRAEDFFREVDCEDLVFRSMLGPNHAVSEHLKWMLGIVQHGAGEFKRMRQEGVDVVLQIHSVLPHKLQLPLEVYFRK